MNPLAMISDSRSVQVKYLYLRDRDRNPVSCLAMIVPPRRLEVVYGLSTLGPGDRFEKRVGRQLALGNAIEEKKLLQVQWTEASWHEILTEIVSAVKADKKTPQKARDAAKRWLRMAKEQREKMAQRAREDEMLKQAANAWLCYASLSGE